MKNGGWPILIVAGWIMLLFQSSYYNDPDDWLAVSAIHVADVRPGDEEPMVRYERHIKQEFRGTWSVELNEVTDDGFLIVCAGTGGSNYKPGDVKPAIYRLSRFIGKQCGIEAGKSYSVDAIWTIRPVGVQPMEVHRTSNVFRVLE